MPLTAAMTGFHTSFRRGLNFLPGSSRSAHGCFGSRNGFGESRRSETSTPEQKARSPDPVRTTALISSFVLTSVHNSANSFAIRAVHEFSFSGRLRVAVKTPHDDRSTTTVSYP